MSCIEVRIPSRKATLEDLVDSLQTKVQSLESQNEDLLRRYYDIRDAIVAFQKSQESAVAHLAHGIQAQNTAQLALKRYSHQSAKDIDKTKNNSV